MKRERIVAMMRKKGKIIILNGVSSSGKTTVSKTLQRELEEPYFWVANDTFCDMYSPKHWKEDWIIAINEALIAMMHTIKQISDLGYNVIVDQVFLNNESQNTILNQCVELLHDYPVLFIRIDSSLADLRRRELERGNRRIGQAESQLNIVHNHSFYDLTINTSFATLEENIEYIKQGLLHIPVPSAFDQLHEKYITTGSVYS